MNESDNDNDLIEVVRKQGECVCTIHWDSGGPGAGADVESIYKFKNEYWYDGWVSPDGPFESFVEAMEAAGGFWITDATQIINCGELSSDEIASRADLSDASPGHRVEINCQEWEVSSDGKLERAGGCA
jgi:hypothetical protein